MNLSNYVNNPNLPKLFGGFFFVFREIFVFFVTSIKFFPLMAEPAFPLVAHTGAFV